MHMPVVRGVTRMGRGQVLRLSFIYVRMYFAEVTYGQTRGGLACLLAGLLAGWLLSKRRLAVSGER